MAEVAPRPLQHLADLSTRYKDAWRAFEGMRADHGRNLPDWPGYVYVPLAGAYAVVSGGGRNRVSVGKVGDVAALAALGAWRMTKGVYRFDPDIMGELWDTRVAGDIPRGVLRHLPEWCVYVETPGRAAAGAPLHGFYAHLERDMNDGREELRLLLDLEDTLTPVPVHLGGGLRAGLERAVAVAAAWTPAGAIPGGAAQTLAGMVEPLVSLTLYLCSEQPDIGGPGRPGNPQPKRVKGGERMFAAPGVRAWDVAVRLGAAYRQALSRGEGRAEVADAADEFEAGGRNAPRPHMRRAHFHTFWAGPRDGKRRAVVKWLPPIPVAFGEDATLLPAVVRKVKK